MWRWLKDAAIQPHRVQSWLNCTDPDLTTRMRDVTGLYLSAPTLASQGQAIFSVDEKTSIGARHRKYPDLPPVPGIPQRIEHEYTRHGTLCLTASFDVVTGQACGVLTPDRPAPVFAGFIDGLCRWHAPDAPAIHLVMDQLNTHWHHDLCEVVADLSGIPYDREKHPKGPDRRELLMRTDKRVIVHYTPKHASWLNQIEIWFSVLARKLLRRAPFTMDRHWHSLPRVGFDQRTSSPIPVPGVTVAPPLDDTSDRLRSLLEQHDVTRGLYVRIDGKHLVLGRRESSFGSQEPEDDDRVRLTHLGGTQFGLSVLRHTGRWVRTPFCGTIEEMLDVMLGTMQHVLAAWP